MQTGRVTGGHDGHRRGIRKLVARGVCRVAHDDLELRLGQPLVKCGLGQIELVIAQRRHCKPSVLSTSTIWRPAAARHRPQPCRVPTATENHRRVSDDRRAGSTQAIERGCEAGKAA